PDEHPGVAEEIGFERTVAAEALEESCGHPAEDHGGEGQDGDHSREKREDQDLFVLAQDGQRLTEDVVAPPDRFHGNPPRLEGVSVRRVSTITINFSPPTYKCIGSVFTTSQRRYSCASFASWWPFWSVSRQPRRRSNNLTRNSSSSSRLSILGRFP